jgi:protein MpaA
VADRSAESSALLGQYWIAGWSVEKRPVMLRVFGQGQDVTFILGGIHGDEVAGTALVRRLAADLNHHPELLQGKTVLLMPLANPDGKALQTRQNGRGVDLNRNFPSPNRVASPESGRWALSEPESRVIYQILRKYRPNRIVSVHQPLGCVDYDGPAMDLAERMAKACGLPIKKLGARPGSMGSYSSQVRHIPIVTLELLDSDSGLSEDQLWARYGKALVAAIE